tara:strand:- start:1301 stop:1570 length:270 start_codon:yes stop_codon:yes gene_type:complete
MPLIEDDNVLSRLLGTLFTEVFQRKTADPNKPLNNAGHLVHQQLVLDEMKIRLEPHTVTYIWGPGGLSDEAGSGSDALSARWSFTAVWG